MRAIKHFTTLWLDTPRWVRGLFIGNLIYIGLVELSLSLPYRSLGIFLPLFPITKARFGLHLPMPHLFWCAFGVLLVQLLGERKGIILLIVLMYALGVALSA